jgi:hypothetical protein
MSLLIQSFSPEKNLFAKQSEWTTIGSLSVTVPFDDDEPNNIAATLSVGEFIAGDQVSNTYHFRILSNEKVIAETAVSDRAIVKKNMDLPVTIMGVDTSARKATIIKAEWMYQGSGNGYLPAKSISSLSVITDYGLKNK